MGCFSSKFVTSTTSYQEELSRSMRKRNKGFPGLEELFVSKNGSDQLLTVPEKPQPTTRVAAEPSNIPCMINSWELMEGLEEQVMLNHTTKWAKSLNGSVSGLQSSLVSDENVGRCGSFHTVEDYDAMMERNKLLDDEEEEFALKNNSNTEIKYGAHHTEEKITRRPSLAKELPLLILPSTIDNNPGVVGNSMEQNESALPAYEEYVTPKFGYFTSLFPVADNSVFDPEILFAFEEEMQDLEQEEETLFKQITAELDADGDGSNEIHKKTSVEVLV